MDQDDFESKIRREFSRVVVRGQNILGLGNFVEGHIDDALFGRHVGWVCGGLKTRTVATRRCMEKLRQHTPTNANVRAACVAFFTVTAFFIMSIFDLASRLIAAIQAPPSLEVNRASTEPNLSTEFVTVLEACTSAEPITLPVSSDGYTALHWAAHCDEPAMISALISKCLPSALDVRNKSGCTPLHIAASRGLCQLEAVSSFSSQ